MLFCESKYVVGLPGIFNLSFQNLFDVLIIILLIVMVIVADLDWKVRAV